MSDLKYRVLRLDELTVQRNCGEDVARKLRADGVAGSQTLGVWLPMMGVSINVVTIATNWTGEPAAHTFNDEAIVSVRTRLFDTLTRGQEPCSRDGIYTQRWFTVAPENVGTLTENSIEAWKSSEVDTAMRVAGFWRCRELNADGSALVLMIVYYPDLAAWDASRYWKPKPAGQEQPNRNVWGGLFAQRRDILLDSLVTVHRPIL